jgi:magnesium chelatase family protein
MTARIKTFVFSGLEAVDVDVQVRVLSGGMVVFNIVGLADKAVAESKERIRAAIASMGLALPARRITVNLAPADLSKEGSHLDLPIAIGILIEMGIIKQEDIDNYVVMGELSLGGDISKVNGILPAAVEANARGLGIICPYENGPEAVWASEEMRILAPRNLISLINHFKGTQTLERPQTKMQFAQKKYLDLSDVKGQKKAKRALEIAAAGGHNMLMIGPPGSGKSMLASRLPGILPDLTLEEILAINMVSSIAGNIKDGQLTSIRPFRDPHHNCSMPAMVGGGAKVRPGEVSLAHCGVLFLDELPEFPKQVLESLRQPMETGDISIARVQSHVTYPANFQLIAAMNPCRCGHLMDEKRQCKKAPLCAQEYQSKISGPLLDRIDISVEVPKIDIFEFEGHDEHVETSEQVRARVIAARNIQIERYKHTKMVQKVNANISNEMIQKYAEPCEEGLKVIKSAIEKLNLSMRGYNRTLKLARTIADLEASENIKKHHILEALSYRRKG